MRQIILAVIMALSIVGFAEAKPKQSLKRGAKLCARELTYDFGVIDYKGGDVHHTFLIENCGDEPLVIERVVTSCSCTKASISRKPLAVGERREMKVTYEVRKMPIGLFSKSILIFSTASDDDMTRFTITGRSSYKSRK